MELRIGPYSPDKDMNKLKIKVEEMLNDYHQEGLLYFLDEPRVNSYYIFIKIINLTTVREMKKAEDILRVYLGSIPSLEIKKKGEYIPYEFALPR